MSSGELTERAGEIEELVKKVKNKDHVAYSDLYDIFVDPIYRYIYFRVNNEDVEDILETVFLKVWENIEKFNPKKGSFSSWIYRITHNLVVDYYRTLKIKDIQELPVNVPAYKREHNPLKVVESSLDKDILKKGLSKLKKQYQEVIIHKFINEFSNKEIGALMKKSEGSIRILQFRALKALKKELENMGIKYQF